MEKLKEHQSDKIMDFDILWDDRLLIGHADIDKQHKRLFAITARIFELGDAATDNVVSDILCELVDYATEHFALEEEILRVIKFPDIAEHIVEHWNFLQQMSVFTDRYERKHNHVMIEIRSYVVDWLWSHISEKDKEYKKYIG